MQLQEALEQIDPLEERKKACPLYISKGDEIVIGDEEWEVKRVGDNDSFILHSDKHENAMIRDLRWLLKQSHEASSFKLVRNNEE